VWSSRTTTKKLVCFRSTADDTQKPNTINLKKQTQGEKRSREETKKP
jgi:hypothetical protein